MSHAPLTVLQLTHQGDGAGLTQSILNLSQHLQRRGHRVLLGCRAESLLARLGQEAGLAHVPLDFSRLGPLPRRLAEVIAVAGRDPPPRAPGRGAARAAREGGGRRVILVAARRKDQDVLLRALAWLTPPVVLACVGVEPDAELAALAAALPPRHRVVFVRFTERPLAFYRLAALAALPSRIEGLSQALLEAMAVGLPVLASDAGGNSDLIAPDTGVLVPPLDPAAWAAALARLLEDPVARARLGGAARALVRRDFTLERTAQRTDVVYQEAHERRRLLRGERPR